MTAGSTDDTYRIGIASSSGTLTQIIASDLQFDTPYFAIASYTASQNDPRVIPVNPVNPFDGQGDMANPNPTPLSGMDGWASLWLSPTSMASSSVTDMAPAENVGNDLRSQMDSIALRQASSAYPGTVPVVEIGVGAFVLGDDFDQVLDLVKLASPGQPGDFDGDDDVDGQDFLIWQRGGSPTALSPVTCLIGKITTGSEAGYFRGRPRAEFGVFGLITYFSAADLKASALDC